jgi:hypothetical protein
MTFDGGAGTKYIKASETMLTMPTAAANPLNSCHRLNPSMTISQVSIRRGTVKQASRREYLLFDYAGKHCADMPSDIYGAPLKALVGLPAPTG